MSCYIRHNNSEEKIVETEWLVGEALPKIDNLKIIEIEISSAELKCFANELAGLIRPPRFDLVFWEGDLARIIFWLMAER